MAIVQFSTAPSRTDYERVAQIVDIAGDRPAGLMLHAASELSSGEVQIVDVWDTAESIAEFSQNRIVPAFAQAGLLDRAMNQHGPTRSTHLTSSTDIDPGGDPQSVQSARSVAADQPIPLSSA